MTNSTKLFNLKTNSGFRSKRNAKKKNEKFKKKLVKKNLRKSLLLLRTKNFSSMKTFMFLTWSRSKTPFERNSGWSKEQLRDSPRIERFEARSDALLCPTKPRSGSWRRGSKSQRSTLWSPEVKWTSMTRLSWPRFICRRLCCSSSSSLSCWSSWTCSRRSFEWSSTTSCASVRSGTARTCCWITWWTARTACCSRFKPCKRKFRLSSSKPALFSAHTEKSDSKRNGNSQRSRNSSKSARKKSSAQSSAGSKWHVWMGHWSAKKCLALALSLTRSK